MPAHYFALLLVVRHFVGASNCCVLINFLSDISSHYFLVPIIATPRQIIRSNDSAMQVFIPEASLRSTVGRQMTCRSCFRSDEVGCTVNEMLAVFVFTFYLIHQLSF